MVLPKRGQVLISPTCSKLIQQEGLQLGSLGYICHTTIGRVTQVLFVHYCVGQLSDAVTMQKVCWCQWFGIFYVWGDVCKRSVIKDGFYLHYQCLQNNQTDSCSPQNLLQGHLCWTDKALPPPTIPGGTLWDKPPLYSLSSQCFGEVFWV